MIVATTIFLVIIGMATMDIAADIILIGMLLSAWAILYIALFYGKLEIFVKSEIFFKSILFGLIVLICSIILTKL